MIDKKSIEESGRQALREPSPAESKAHIKTLVENSSVSKVRNTKRIVKYGAVSFTRNIWLSLAATLVMTVTLLILMVTVGASLVLNATATTMREKIDITIFFRPNTDAATLDALKDIMASDPNVKSVEVADSATEYANFVQEYNDDEDILAALDDEAMQELMVSSMQATMRVKVQNTENLESIKQLVATNELFQASLDPEKDQTYDANQAEIATINSWANIAKNGGLILGAVFLVISILVIFNTIRMAIFSRREEIYMMKLVGADTGFIRGPFLIEAEICGLISGILATTLALIGFKFLEPELSGYGIDVSTVAEFMDTNYLVVVYAVIVAIGLLIGTISARLAMKKYLK